MAIKRHKPEGIVTKLRQVEVLCGQGMRRVDAIRQVQIKCKSSANNGADLLSLAQAAWWDGNRPTEATEATSEGE